MATAIPDSKITHALGLIDTAKHPTEVSKRCTTQS
ncbi:hypothetical protein BV339_00284 [Pseudomonas syringae pv. actinidiae]|nr:hypothetical protein BV339_00284 [Pseudomonas syringae pv. actinidiae]